MDRVYFAKLPALATVAAVAIVAIACSPARWHEVAGARAKTGDALSDRQIAPGAPLVVERGEVYCVYSDRLLGQQSGQEDRPIGSQASDAAAAASNGCVLDRGTRLRILAAPAGASTLADAELAANKSQFHCPAHFLVPILYLERCADSGSRPAPSASDPGREAGASSRQATAATGSAGVFAPGLADRYFAVQNIATEKMRVYEACRASGCEKHRLVLEVDMLAGPDKDGRRTRLGEFRVSAWHKFYADNEGHYPAFFDPTYPGLPARHASLNDWLSRALLPGGKGLQRGNFGWFTAYLEPNADSQWLAGTWGWGEDGDRFLQIARQRNYDASLFDLDTHGCTRVDNPTVAFLRYLLPERALVLRVYARESLRAPSAPASAPAQEWPWLLTAGDGADGKTLDQGTYLINSVANVVPFSAATGAGNKYNVDAKAMRGTFFVDQGMFANYEHPIGLAVGGYGDRPGVPSFMTVPRPTP